jgi:CBS domain-containing protein
VLAQPDAEALAALPALADYEVPEQLLVGDLMNYLPRTVSPDTPLRDAARELVRAGVRGLPVVDEGGRVIGMLTEQEIMRDMVSSYLQGAASGPPASGRRLVRDVMTRQVLCVSPDQPLAEAASILSNKDVDRVPVVRGGRLVGLLTRGDVVRKLIGP